MFDSLQIDPREVRDISDQALDEHGRLRILPAAFWAGTTVHERALFGHRHGLYGFPTVELVEHLRRFIGDRTAIEIGAGHGALADALGIPGTDNRMQEKTPYREIYALTRQPAVRYGPHIIDCDAHAALQRFRPQVVIGSWVTHRYDPARHFAGGNEVGVDEDAIIDGCAVYLVIGNERVHRAKKIWDRPHRIAYPGFLYSRAGNGTRDFLAAWAGGSAPNPPAPLCE